MIGAITQGFKEAENMFIKLSEEQTKTGELDRSGS